VTNKPKLRGAWMQRNYHTRSRFCKYIVSNLIKYDSMRQVQQQLFTVRQGSNEKARDYLQRASGLLRILNWSKTYKQDFYHFWTYVTNGLDRALEHNFRNEVSRTDLYVNIRNYAVMDAANLEKNYDALKHALFTVENKMKLDRDMKARYRTSSPSGSSRYGNRRSYDRAAYADSYSDAERRREQAAYGGVQVPSAQHVTGHKGSSTPARSKWDNRSPGRDRQGSQYRSQGTASDREYRRRNQTRPRDQGIMPPPVSAPVRDLSGAYPWTPHAHKENQKFPTTLFLAAEDGTRDLSKVICFRCGKPGHMARACMEVKPAVLNLLADDNMVFHHSIENFEKVLYMQGMSFDDLGPDTVHVMGDMICSAAGARQNHVGKVTGRPYEDTEEESPEDESHSPVRSGYDTGDSEGSLRRR
jgi:hypothetical protein